MAGPEWLSVLLGTLICVELADSVLPRRRVARRLAGGLREKCGRVGRQSPTLVRHILVVGEKYLNRPWSLLLRVVRHRHRGKERRLLEERANECGGRCVMTL